MVSKSSYVTCTGSIITELVGHGIILRTFQPAPKEISTWHCRVCKLDKTYSFAYYLQRESKEWWCEDCVRKAGLIW